MFINAANEFLIYGDFIKAELFGNGHINETYLAEFNQAGLPVRYIIRKINKYVFRKPEIVIRNTVNAVEHITKKISETDKKDIACKVLTLVKSKTNKFCFKDENGDFWCAVLFFENAYTIDYVKTARQAYSVAKEFGKFQKHLIDDDVSKYQPSIPDFHNVSKRIKLLQKTLEENTHGRVKAAEKEIELTLSYKYLSDKINELINSGKLKQRITHHDTKINNVMFDKKTGKGMCVIDLDTVMPGFVIFDFGDIVRTSTCPAAEDEKDISKVVMQINFFDAVVKGYLEELGTLLTGSELNNLVYGTELIIYEQAIRFLTDFLCGDIYYHTKYKNHNLVRTRNQLALLSSVQAQRKRMEEIVHKYLKK